MGSVPGWNAYSYAFGPVIAAVGLGVLVLLLRWTFRRGSSLVPPPARPGPPQEYGLLVPVARPDGTADGEAMCRTLQAAGIRATLTGTLEGPRVMVFAADADQARAVLDRRG